MAENTKIRLPWRKNVLLLVGFAYLAILAVFGGIMLAGSPCTIKDAADAYDTIKEPLMAVIGGSLAISKDLIPRIDGFGTPPQAQPPDKNPGGK